ncbi:MAG: SDR family oxidoreductase [Chloroflexi bacterium]|nr:SDR family oxidoreductase [Chloroflexota bacterium]
MRLRERHVVVTGAGQGIGRAIARGVAREGARVTCADIRGAAAEDAARQIVAEGGQALGVAVDVRDLASVEALLAAAERLFGRVHAVFANAGGSYARKPFLELTPADWETDRLLNLDGAFNTGFVFAHHMAAHGGGAIVFTSSQLSEVARPDLVPYCAAKGGVRMLARAMAIDLATHGIRVNCLAPGPTLSERLVTRHTPETLAQEVKLIPMGRMGQPDDMVGAAVFLAGDESSWVTGTTIFVDGGYVAW